MVVTAEHVWVVPMGVLVPAAALGVACSVAPSMWVCVLGALGGREGWHVVAVMGRWVCAHWGRWV